MKTKKVLARLCKLFANNGNGCLYAVLIAGWSWLLANDISKGKAHPGQLKLSFEDTELLRTFVLYFRLRCQRFLPE